MYANLSNLILQRLDSYFLDRFASKARDQQQGLNVGSDMKHILRYEHTAYSGRPKGNCWEDNLSFTST